jgi:hypothetical protein
MDDGACESHEDPELVGLSAGGFGDSDRPGADKDWFVYEGWGEGEGREGL